MSDQRGVGSGVAEGVTDNEPNAGDAHFLATYQWPASAARFIGEKGATHKLPGMNAPPTSFSLWYRDVLVGHVRDAFLSEGTWFGRFEPAFRPDDGGLPGRLREYVRFCENWNERQLAGLGDV